MILFLPFDHFFSFFIPPDNRWGSSAASAMYHGTYPQAFFRYANAKAQPQDVRLQTRHRYRRDDVRL